MILLKFHIIFSTTCFIVINYCILSIVKKQGLDFTTKSNLRGEINMVLYSIIPIVNILFVGVSIYVRSCDKKQFNKLLLHTIERRTMHCK